MNRLLFIVFISYVLRLTGMQKLKNYQKCIWNGFLLVIETEFRLQVRLILFIFYPLSICLYLIIISFSFYSSSKIYLHLRFRHFLSIRLPTETEGETEAAECETLKLKVKGYSKHESSLKQSLVVHLSVELKELGKTEKQGKFVAPS